MIAGELANSPANCASVPANCGQWLATSRVPAMIAGELRQDVEGSGELAGELANRSRPRPPANAVASYCTVPGSGDTGECSGQPLRQDVAGSGEFAGGRGLEWFRR